MADGYEDDEQPAWLSAELSGRFDQVNTLMEREGPFALRTFEADMENKQYLHEDCCVCVAGAGSLGCEVIKNLILMGFGTIHIIDNDIVEEENLAGSVFFRKTDIGRPKVTVITDFVLRRYPHVAAEGHNCRVEERTLMFYRKFNIIVNCTDSIATRRWLNSMVVNLVDYDEDGHIDGSSLVPYIDGYFEGMRGYVNVTLPTYTACWECRKKHGASPQFNAFQPPTALCTLENQPRIPQHCVEYVGDVMWSKQFPTSKIDLKNAIHAKWVYHKAHARGKQFGIRGVTPQIVGEVCKCVFPFSPVSPGILGSMVANECFKVTTHRFVYMKDLLMYNGQDGARTMTYENMKDPHCLVCSRQSGHLETFGMTEVMMSQFKEEMLVEKQQPSAVQSKAEIEAEMRRTPAEDRREEKKKARLKKKMTPVNISYSPSIVSKGSSVIQVEDVAVDPEDFMVDENDELEQPLKQEDFVRERATVEEFYEFGKVLGKGNFGVVYEVTNRKSGEKFACKEMDKKMLEHDEGSEVRLRAEVDILKRAGCHENITQLFEVFETKSHLYLVMEIVDGGELFDTIVGLGSYTENDARRAFRQIVAGIAHLHTKDIVHRDLKPENLLVQGSGIGSIVKITDFGLSKVVGVRGQEVLETRCGSPLYIAPEILTHSPRYGREVDMWSAGVILFILLSGEAPFFDPDPNAAGDGFSLKMVNMIRNAEYSFAAGVWKHVSLSAKGLIEHLLTIDPAKRLTAEQALQHPWLKEEDKPVESPEVLMDVTTNLRLTTRRRANEMNTAVKMRKKETQNTLDVMMEKVDIAAAGTPAAFVQKHYKKLMIKKEKVTWTKVLDKGAFAEVSQGTLAISRSKKVEVAIKQLLSMKADDDLRDFLKEIEMLRTLDHPSVLRFLGLVVRPPSFAIVTEFCSRGSLYDMLYVKKEKLTNLQKHELCVDIAKGLEYLHTRKQKIVHRDLKTPNVLVTSDLRAKIADFGASKMKNMSIDQTQSRSFVGSPLWMAPEVIRAEPYNTKADVFSFAVVCWEIWEEELPYKNKSAVQVILHVEQGNRPAITEKTPASYARLITKCWQHKPEARPPMTDVLQYMESECAIKE